MNAIISNEIELLKIKQEQSNDLKQWTREKEA